MSSSLDYLELCRLCLVKDRVSVPIFEDEGDVRQIFLKITACLPVKVSREDKLPKKICDDCVYKVELFYQFWNTTANAEKQLLQWLGEVGGLEDKQGYVTEVLDTNVMKQERSSDSRLDGSVMQVGGHQNSMDMGMMDIITMPAGSEQQFTSVPMDTSGTVQTVQVVPGPSTQTTHDQMAQSQTTHLGEESEEENSDDGCDNEEGLPVKEEHEDDQGDQPLETTTFVALPCDEAGPSGLQQQKISEISEMSMQQTADNDPKTGYDSAEAESIGVTSPTKKTVFIRKNNTKTKSSPEQESSMTLYQVSIVNGKASYSLLPIKEAETKRASPKKTNQQTDQKFTCDECDLQFTTIIRLKAHKSTHKPLNKLSKVSRIRCNEETAATPTLRRKQSLKSYDETEDADIAFKPKQAGNKDLTFICPSCEFSTDNRNIMLNHFSVMHGMKSSDIKHESNEQQTHDDEVHVENNEELEEIVEEEHLDQLNCGQCGFTCNTQDDLDFHTCEPPEECTSFSCHLCTYECLTRMGLQSHITRKHRPKPEKGVSNEYECDECEFRSQNKSSLYSHKRRHRSGKLNVSVKSSENKFFCNECDFAARIKSALYLHIQRRHKLMDSKPERPEFYSCEHCDYTNKTKYEMKVHVIRKHTNEYPHECKDCGKKYKIKGDLTNHIRFQHREQPIICDVCGKTCGNSNSLYVHQKFAHYKAEFECPICHRRMVSQANLDEHVLKQHEQREDAVCEECGKTFTRQSRLKIHMRIHTGLKPHACKICGKAFSRKTALRQHLLIHTGQRPYVCDICGKTFTQKPGLISHRKSHPGSHPPLPRVTIDHVLSDLLTEEDGVC